MPSITKDSASDIVPKEFSLSLSSPVRVQVAQEYSKIGRTSERKTRTFDLLHKYRRYIPRYFYSVSKNKIFRLKVILQTKTV